MYLVEKHIINQYHSFFNECDELCFKSKNIYNQVLYNVRQHYFKNNEYLNYYKNYHVTKLQECYKELPTKVFCQTLKMVDQNFKSFFGLLKNKNIKNHIPKYLDSKNGRYLTKFPKQALSIKEFKTTGKILLSQTHINIQTKIKDFNSIKEVRIVPLNDNYVIEIVYKIKEKDKKENGIIAGIDLGLNNFATVVFNDGSNPLLFNGRPLKSINQYYNKRKSYYQSKLEKNTYTSKKIKQLTNKRNNIINNYLHNISRELVNQLVSHNVMTLVIGKNVNMKQDINLGKVNNQNITNIPLFKFVDIIKYKCELEGINVILQEESYTSKCSFFDNEEIKKHDNYLGKRIKRGLFKTFNSLLINADVNGAYNILKKAIPNAFTNGIEGVGVHPLMINI